METDLLFEYWVKKQFEYGRIKNEYNHLKWGGSTKVKWHTLFHNGVLFPPEYEQHKTPLLFKGEKVVLNPEAEEYATIYAKYIDTDYSSGSTFRKNFWGDWKKTIDKELKIDNFAECDFSLIKEYIITKLANREKPTDEEKEKKTKKEEKYTMAKVDGKDQPVGNFRVEPPGIYIGRGCNPKSGKLKKRIRPKDITINIGRGETSPELPEGQKWGAIIHDQSVEWLASWMDNVTGKIKYIWLSAHSDNKGKKDMEKFDLARNLKKKIKKIREHNEKILESGNVTEKQIATAIYFIDNYALRVGNEKSEDETDTVGVTSLRVEHVTLLEGVKVKLDFLSKDSVRYNKTTIVPQIVYDNITKFMMDKEKYDQLFDRITSSDINKHLQKFMKGLTAKVFRTYNASYLFQKELKKIRNKYDINTSPTILKDEFNRANGKVAILCNHQKNINKNTGEQIKKIKDALKKAKKDIEKTNNPNRKKILREKIKKLQVKKSLKSELKNISLGTSKINYIDPRITVAFAKKYNIPIEQFFTGKLVDKFRWALDVDVDYRF